MIKIEDFYVRGLSEVPETRRSFNSTKSGDSNCVNLVKREPGLYILTESTTIGPKDLSLMEKLEVSGDSHAKMNRFIEAYLTLTMPRRVWVDFDTYRLGCDNIQPDDIEYFSDSTMHTLGKTSTDNIFSLFDEYTCAESVIVFEKCLNQYKANPSEDLFLKMKSSLPEGFLQARRMKINYQALRHIYFDRRKHRQPEFREFCDWIEGLPYSELIIKEKEDEIPALKAKISELEAILAEKRVHGFNNFI